MHLVKINETIKARVDLYGTFHQNTNVYYVNKLTK